MLQPQARPASIFRANGKWVKKTEAQDHTAQLRFAARSIWVYKHEVKSENTLFLPSHAITKPTPQFKMSVRR